MKHTAPCPHRRTQGILAIARRHPRLFARLAARVQRPLERPGLGFGSEA